MSNALKHARPAVIELDFSFEESAVRLVVSDDGPGFDPAAVSAAGSHFGLQGMRERVERMHGKFSVGRGANGGTRVEVVVEAPA